MTAVDLIHSNGRARPQSGAAVQAHSKLAQICHSLAAEPLETMDETLRHCLPFVEEMITLGLVERVDAADQLWNALLSAGLVAQRGPDATQRILAEGLTRRNRKQSSAGQTSLARAASAQPLTALGLTRSRWNGNLLGAIKPSPPPCFKNRHFHQSGMWFLASCPRD